jgi:hypothetical protein
MVAGAGSGHRLKALGHLKNDLWCDSGGQSLKSTKSDLQNLEYRTETGQTDFFVIGLES